MRRVTADTNLYVSALNFHGPPRAFLRLASEGLIRYLTRSLRSSTKTSIGPRQGPIAVRKTLLTLTESVEPTVILDMVKDDPDDKRILECAQAAHSDCVVKEMQTCFGLATMTE